MEKKITQRTRANHRKTTFLFKNPLASYPSLLSSSSFSGLRQGHLSQLALRRPPFSLGRRFARLLDRLLQPLVYSWPSPSYFRRPERQQLLPQKQPSRPLLVPPSCRIFYFYAAGAWCTSWTCGRFDDTSDTWRTGRRLPLWST